MIIAATTGTAAARNVCNSLRALDLRFDSMGLLSNLVIRSSRLLVDDLRIPICLLGLAGYGGLESLAFPTGRLARALGLLLEFRSPAGDTERIERFSHFFQLGRHVPRKNLQRNREQTFGERA